MSLCSRTERRTEQIGEKSAPDRRRINGWTDGRRSLELPEANFQPIPFKVRTEWEEQKKDTFFFLTFFLGSQLERERGGGVIEREREGERESEQPVQK